MDLNNDLVFRVARRGQDQVGTAKVVFDVPGGPSAVGHRGARERRRSAAVLRNVVQDGF